MFVGDVDEGALPSFAPFLSVLRSSRSSEGYLSRYLVLGQDIHKTMGRARDNTPRRREFDETDEAFFVVHPSLLCPLSPSKVQ